MEWVPEQMPSISPKPSCKCSRAVSKMPNDLFACGRPRLTLLAELGQPGSGRAACPLPLLFDPAHIWLGLQLEHGRQASLNCVLWPPHNISVMKLGKDGLILSITSE